MNNNLTLLNIKKINIFIMNPHKYVNCFQPKKQPDSVISVNQKPIQNIKITEKDCTDLQSLVKKSVDDINILFSLKQIQSSFTNIDTLRRKNQSLSVEKTIQRKFNSKATLNETANTLNAEPQKQNYTLNINNFINISNKTKKQQQQQPKYNYDDDSICDNNILTTSMNNTARLATIDNSNSNRTSRKSFGEKGKEIYKHNTKVFDGSSSNNNNIDKKKNQTKESLRNYVNVKHKGTKKGTYKGDECNNSINESGFIKMKNEICDNNNNKVGNDNMSSIINGNNSYRSSKCNSNNNSNNNTIRKGVSNGSINFNSANTSKLMFNKVASQYQQHKVNIQSKHNKNKHQIYNPFNNNTIDCNISINSKKSNEHILSHTLNQTETSYISKQINNNPEHSISLSSTQTPLPNDSIPHQSIQPKNPFQKYISKNIIKVQKARSSSIVFDNTTHNNNTNTNSHSIKSKSPHIPLTTPNTPSKHNPSPLRKPSSSLLFSTQNYHSIINKIYTKEFPYKTFTTNDILKLMLFLNEYLIYTNALKDLNNMKILSNYSQLLSKNINIEHPRIEHIDLCKYDKFITSAKVIQRKWRERFVKKHIGNNNTNDDEVNELKRMMFSKYIMKMGFKLKKVTGLFNSVVEGFGEIENDTNTTEMLCSVIKLITGNITTNEKHLLYKEYINNIILHQI